MRIIKILAPINKKVLRISASVYISIIIKNKFNRFKNYLNQLVSNKKSSVY